MLAGLATVGRADETKLAETLTVKDVQGGFAGFTGKQSSRQAGRHVRRRRTCDNETMKAYLKGDLRTGRLADLVKELEALDGLDDLPAKKPARSMANPHLVTIKLGKREVTLELNARARSTPKPRPRTNRRPPLRAATPASSTPCGRPSAINK